MSELSTFHTDIKNILEQARGKVRSAVNAAMVEAYWLIGRRIVEEEQRGQRKSEYGTRLIEDLSTALTADFGKGFSYANLCNCRQFYLTFPDQAILYTACRELSWSHLRLIMRVDSRQAIDYYCREAREQNWTVRQLERNIKSQSFQRLLSTQASPTSIKCFVIIDLKTGKLNHQDIGQMDMYVRMFDDLKRGEDDNPTIGIILCDSKDETVVKYSILQGSQQLFASKYQRVLPTEDELIAEIEREKRLIKHGMMDTTEPEKKKTP